MFKRLALAARCCRYEEPLERASALNAAPDERTLATVTAVAAVTRSFETMAAVGRTVAAIERFGLPAIVSPSPLTPAEAARLFRDAPPPLSPADKAAFAAAARDFDRFFRSAS